MVLTSSEERALRALGVRLEAQDPVLARRLSEPITAPSIGPGTPALLLMVACEMVVGFLPMVLGVVLGSRSLIVIGVVVAVVGVPAATVATTEWARRRRAARGDDEPSPKRS